MPNPASSGTGYLDVTGWLQMWGDADGWKFMDALHENIAQYTHSGSASPAYRPAPANSRSACRSNIAPVTTKKSKGGPIDLIFPNGGSGLGPRGVRAS